MHTFKGPSFSDTFLKTVFLLLMYTWIYALPIIVSLLSLSKNFLHTVFHSNCTNLHSPHAQVGSHPFYTSTPTFVQRCIVEHGEYRAIFCNNCELKVTFKNCIKIFKKELSVSSHRWCLGTMEGGMPFWVEFQNYRLASVSTVSTSTDLTNQG